MKRHYYPRAGWLPVLALAGALCLPAAALAQGALTNGAHHTGSISASGQVDTWTFDATAGDTIVVSMGELTSSTLAPWVRVFNPAAAQVAEKFDLQASQVTVTAAQTGTYTVLAGSRDFNGITTGLGNYRLTLAQIPVAFSTSGGDEGGALTNGAEHTGSIPMGDLDMWSFNATAGDTLIISMGEIVSGSTLSPWIRLFNPSGAQVAAKLDLQASQVVVTAGATGTYTVVAGTSDFNSLTNGVGDYRVTIAAVPGPFVTTAGDEGGALSNGGEHTGTILLGDLDMWSFTATAGDSLALSLGELVNGSTLSPWIRLYSPTGVLLGSKFDLQVSQINLTAALTGTYTVVVATSDFNAGTNGTGTYRVTMAKMPGPFVVTGGDEGGAAINGAEQIGTIALGDLDMWTITATAGDSLIVSVGETVNGADLSPWIRLFSPTGGQVAQAFNLQAAQFSVTAGLTGTYTIVVGSINFNGNNAGTGQYRLTVAQSPGAYATSGGDQGGVTTSGTQQTGTILVGDLDMWTFSAHAGETVTVNLAETVNGSALSPWIRVFNKTGALVGEQFGLQSSQVIVDADDNGLYTIVVGTTDFNSNVSGSGDYTLTVTGIQTNWITNGDFANGRANWLLFEVPDIVHNNAANGVFEFHKADPTTTATGQAVIFQNTGRHVAAGVPLISQFDIGNSDSVRKRITVLIIESDFSDLSVCTFFLGPNVPLRTFTMKTHPTEAWTNASLYFYAASPGGSANANYQVDNVSLMADPAGSSQRTDCFDPEGPAVGAGTTGPDLLINGDFETGSIAPWSVFGDIGWQVSGGVFEFVRPGTPGLPAGVILQPTGAAVAAHEVLTAAFDLGNSSSVRKRVTVILHDLDFSDLTACTFWLEPAQALQTYAMRSFTTKAWSNATLSVYAATTGPEQWMRLDNASLRRTPGVASIGTECIEPGNAGANSGSVTVGTAPALATDSMSGAATASAAARPAQAARQEPATSDSSVRLQIDSLDVPAAGSAQLIFDSWLPDVQAFGTVEVSLDGSHWQSIAVLPPSDDWLRVAVDLTPFAGRTIHLRFVLDASSPADAVWIIKDPGADASDSLALMLCVYMKSCSLST